MRAEFFQIIQEASSIFSWNREIGIQYLDISEESVRTISRWSDKYNRATVPSIHAKLSSIPEKGALKPPDSDIRQYVRNPSPPPHSDNKHKPLTHPSLPQPVGGVINIDANTHADIHRDDNIHCTGDSNSQIFFLSEAFDYTTSTGELFMNILKAMNLGKDTVCLCTFEPLDYRRGIPEVRQRISHIREQAENLIDEVKITTNGFHPKIISTLGDSALKIMMGIEYMLTSSRGKFYNWNGIALMPTYHPAHILTDKSLKRLVWEDMKQIMRITAPNRGLR